MYTLQNKHSLMIQLSDRVSDTSSSDGNFMDENSEEEICQFSETDKLLQ